jgi:hypothetical protein
VSATAAPAVVELRATSEVVELRAAPATVELRVDESGALTMATGMAEAVAAPMKAKAAKMVEAQCMIALVVFTHRKL